MRRNPTMFAFSPVVDSIPYPCPDKLSIAIFISTVTLSAFCTQRSCHGRLRLVRRRPLLSRPSDPQPRLRPPPQRVRVPPSERPDATADAPARLVGTAGAG